MKDVTLAVAFAVQDDETTPNIRGTKQQRLMHCYRNMCVAFGSARKWNPAADLVLVTTTPPPPEVSRVLGALAVELVQQGYEHKRPSSTP